VLTTKTDLCITVHLWPTWNRKHPCSLLILSHSWWVC